MQLSACFSILNPLKKGEFEAPKYGFPMGAAFKDFETLQGAFANEGVGQRGKRNHQSSTPERLGRH